LFFSTNKTTTYSATRSAIITSRHQNSQTQHYNKNIQQLFNMTHNTTCFHSQPSFCNSTLVRATYADEL